MLRLRSHGKINWHLEVVRRLPDGYHELRTLFQTIDLADELTLQPLAHGIELEVAGSAAGLAADSSNLAWRAAELYLSRFADGRGGVKIRLEKRIPVGAGLGGGSSNAAAVLAGLARLHGHDPERAELREAAKELGADVPFFLVGGVALGTGRGDTLLPLDDSATTSPALRIAVPPFAVSTRDVFVAHRVGVPRPAGRPLSLALAGELPAELVALEGWNDLEPTCFGLFPRLGDVYNRLTVSGASWVRLSGSGGAICALFADARVAEAAGAALPPGFGWLTVRPLRRIDWRMATGW